MCKWYEVEINPRDVLFFRSAKPISGSAIGEGANWPMPSVFHQAMLSAFHAKWETHQDWEHAHQNRNEKNMASSSRFGGLKTIGVFPSVNDEIYVPMPSDVQVLNDKGKELCVLEPRKLERMGDLPKPLSMGLFKPENSEATKRNPKRWISLTDLQRYLAGGDLTNKDIPDFFDVENRTGIAIDPETGTADQGSDDEGGKLYLAEYMRLRDDVSFKAFATCEQVRYADSEEKVDVLDKYFDGTATPFIFGGQRGVAQLNGVRNSEIKTPFDISIQGTQTTRIKWVTLTPSIFTGGWLPSWLDAESGEIFIYEKPPRSVGENRKEWRARIEREGVTKKVIGKLVAASIGKPIPHSGWRTHGGNGNQGCKPTRLCVPAGAVYYFEATDPDALIELLNGKCKSDMGAEKGFGFGLCGIWKSEEKTGEK